MPKARSRKLLVLAIACSSITAALVAAWGVSACYCAGFFAGYYSNPLDRGFLLSQGSLFAFWAYQPGLADQEWLTVRYWYWRPGPQIWSPSIQRNLAGWSVTLPIWIPTVLALFGTINAWRHERRSRRPIQPELCPRCGYNNAATPTGAPCPECGTPTSSTTAAPIDAAPPTA